MDMRGLTSEWSLPYSINIRTPPAKRSGRSNHTSVVFDNKIWVMGGSGTNEVWYSADGRDWSRATSSAQWSARYMHTSVVFDNKMWVLGGAGGLNEVWYSTNGKFWVCEASLTKFASRSDHTAVVFDNMIWVMGGFGIERPLLNDVWYRTLIE